MSIEAPENFKPTTKESPVSPKDLESYLNDYSKVLNGRKEEPADPAVKEMLAMYRVVCSNGVLAGIAKDKAGVAELAKQCRGIS